MLCSLNKPEEDKFELLLQAIREEAAKNNFTEEILFELLNEDN